LNLASVEQVVQKPPYLVLKFYVVLKSIRDATLQPASFLALSPIFG
jgi:hypothetical protein